MVSKSHDVSHLKIGLLGGGQLARMLILRGHQLGLNMKVLSLSADDPAAQVCAEWVQGDPKDTQTVRGFLKTVDILTFESEFVDDHVIKLLKTSSKVFPSAQNMELFQDRWTQKMSLQKAKLPSAPFKLAGDNPEDLQSERPFGRVYKARRFGYDGNGTWVVKKGQSLPVSSKIHESAANFIVEDFISFKRELALTFVCSSAGKIISLPLVETKQQENRCLWVKGPVTHKAHTALEKKLRQYLKNIHYVGAITFELFDTGERLLINEVAPRVHNSAHYSWDALNEDQFTLHLKALIGAKLEPPRSLAKGFAMYNLIGSTQAPPRWTLPPGVSLHWYGKKDNRPGRKMGHLNTLGASASKALTQLLKAKKDFKL